MRVVAGKYGSRPLKAVPGTNTRPTTDKIKESMFNLLGGYFGEGKVLDLYGGTGGLAIEAISRGMTEAVICEKYRPAIQTIKHNISVTQEAEKFILLQGNNRQELTRYKTEKTDLVFDLVFIDPPYKQQMIQEDIEWLTEQGLIDLASIIVCETDDETKLPETFGQWIKYREKKYGQTIIHLYEWREE